MGTVFISYRREDTAGEARALYNDLVERLGEDAVFMDVDAIALGRDFRQVLQERLASCDLMLVLIGKSWADARDGTGRPRLEDEGDFVRLEVGTALKRNIRVTPVLVQGARIPGAERLPDDLKDLAYRNGFELSHGRWQSDVREMVRRLGLDAAGRTGEPRRRRWAVALGSCLLVLAVAGGGLLYSWGTDKASHPLAPAPDPGRPAQAVEARIFLHTLRPAPDTEKVRSALVAAGYKSVSGPDAQRDPFGDAVDYSTKDGTRDYRQEAQRIADIINKAVGSDLKPRPQSSAAPGYFGVWF